MNAFSESTVEEATLDWFRSLDWTIKHGPDITPGEPAAERGPYCQRRR